MELDVSKAFLAPGGEYPFAVKVSLPPQDVAGETVTFDEVHLEGTYAVLEERVYLQGTLKTVAHGDCALCMESADVPLEFSFSETFRKNVNETEDEDFRFEGKAVPLTQMTLTLVMLSLPMRFLCGECSRETGEAKAWQVEETPSSREEGTPTQRPFEALQSLLKKDEEV